MRVIKSLLPIILILLMSGIGYAQVTTSSITGIVKDSMSRPLEGATITATHQPSGTVYATISKRGGVFNIPNARIGGPYSVKVEYVGFKPEIFDGIFLQLGEPYNVNAVMGEDIRDLSTVTIIGRRRRLTADKTGASTNIGQRQIVTLPTISRSITDFTRLTPQANGNNFAGRDARYNNLQVDGANLNNNFGLSSDPLPGGGYQPISLDAIEEVSVNIAPYDVRQSGFTGAGINAVTKSGTNTFHGTLYGYFRNQDYNGTKVASSTISKGPDQSNKVYGAAIGGPIIKDKLFFFISAEKEQRQFPGVTYSPTGGSGSGNVSSTPIDSLKKLSDYLKAAYNYDPGAYDNFPNFQAENHKILGRLDWNISKVHKVTVKYNDFKSTNPQQVNLTSVPNGGGFSVVGGTGTLSRLPNNRVGTKSMAFDNSNYGFKDIVKSGTFELNSNFSGKSANQFLATFTKVRDTRTFNGGIFPTIDIFNNDGNNYMSVGMDPFTNNNDVINNIYSFIDNFTYFAGKHTITAGASYEYQKVGNMFMSGSNQYYAFNSLNDFMTNRPPAYYAYTYSLVKGQPAVYSANLKIGQLGVYVQDEINVNERFKLTAGIRIDKPIYLEKALENPAVTALEFPDAKGNPTHYNTSNWPKGTILWSPRIGFRWDVDGDRSLIIRGGTGLFTGKIPFVFLTNMPTNSGMYQFGGAITSASRLQNYLFTTVTNAYQDSFPSAAGTSAPTNIVVMDPNFKFPQIWRTNIAFDKRFGMGWTFTVEAAITKDVHAVRMRNANQKDPNAQFTNNSDTRPRYLTTADRKEYPNLSSAIVLENTNKGGGFFLTTQISKSFSNGFYGSFAYTYTYSGDVTANPGSQATSVWNANPTRGTQNDLELAYSQYAIPHRLVGTVSYRREYLKHLATTISLFYEGTSLGNYSYVYASDLNNDGNNTTDLMYIPKDPSDIIFKDRAANAGQGIVGYTAQQQSDAFFQLIENTPYLRKHKGQYAERNSSFLPWLHRVDFKLLQDVFANIGDRRHTMQLSLDILNFANLLNRDWGVQKQTIVRNPLQLQGVDAQGRPNYYMNQVGGKLVTEPFQNTLSSFSTWGIQLGLRYIF